MVRQWFSSARCGQVLLAPRPGGDSPLAGQGQQAKAGDAADADEGGEMRRYSELVKRDEERAANQRA